MQTPRSANIKIVLIVIAVAIVVGTLLYTRQLVKELLEREREVADLYAKSLEFIANRPADKIGDQSDYSFIFDEVIRSIDFPMVLSDAHGDPLFPYATNARNVRFDSTLSPEEQREFFRDVIRRLDTHNPPIKVAIQDSIVVSYVHYGESELITKLRWLPYIEIVVAGMFIILGYVGFSTIKRSEQSNIWVGMSKETAHQLGTPISSLMGWIEIMKGYAAQDPKQVTTIAEMERDINRLQRVTDRFSKIGSKPSLKDEDLSDVIQSIVEYFKQRLPSRFGDGRDIDIRIESQDHPTAKINRELFGWVIENLIKNAIDAMEDGKGSITFFIFEKGGTVYIDVKDTGKGIDMKQRQDIFRPGYSTKQRGWGLGLSLSKRIIESYHKGKIFVKDSKLGKGTTFRIKLGK
ncbi:MAG: HAMP domain-containing histidine kinase [Ignavibacteriae bacterium]|nr:HAMP domain-containing histidine kinase [Ignavibacteria bacterium]MBI3364685.1 HAMP domain-containing histidine kinase [Ignavibacteriota bacterium]